MNDLGILEATIERFNQFIKALPAHALKEREWGPKEVLAHLVYHHERYVIMVQGSLTGAPLEPPKGRFRDLNAKAVASSRGVSPEVLVERLQGANRRLIELYQQCDPREKPMQIKAGGKIWTLVNWFPGSKRISEITWGNWPGNIRKKEGLRGE